MAASASSRVSLRSTVAPARLLLLLGRSWGQDCGFYATTLSLAPSDFGVLYAGNSMWDASGDGGQVRVLGTHERTALKFRRPPELLLDEVQELKSQLCEAFLVFHATDVKSSNRLQGPSFAARAIDTHWTAEDWPPKYAVIDSIKQSESFEVSPLGGEEKVDLLPFLKELLLRVTYDDSGMISDFAFELYGTEGASEMYVEASSGWAPLEVLILKEGAPEECSCDAMAGGADEEECVGIGARNAGCAEGSWPIGAILAIFVPVVLFPFCCLFYRWYAAQSAVDGRDQAPYDAGAAPPMDAIEHPAPSPASVGAPADVPIAIAVPANLESGRKCTKCHKQGIAGQSFCGHCGGALEGAPPPTELGGC